MERALWLLSAANGFLAVALGAFGAHGLKARFAALADAAQRTAWWETAAHYHLTHALALGLCAALVPRVSGSLPAVAAGCFAAGIALFSGSLYVMALTGVRALGAITPLGGLGLLAGWAALAAAALRLR